MPARIPLSNVKALGFDFAEAVKNYRTALADWANRPADWDVTPAPTPLHPLVGVAAAVESYELVDDTPAPPAPPALEDRKTALVNAVRRAHAAANEAVMPQLKRPLFDLRLRQALGTKFEDRMLGDRETLNDRKGIEARLSANELHAAHQLAAIADLTDETLGAWIMQPFPEAAAAAPPSIEDRRAQIAADIDEELAKRTRDALHPLKRELLELQVRAAGIKPEDQRTAQDLDVLKQFADYTAQIQLLQIHAAKLKAELVDLGEKSLAAWKPAPFPGG